MNKWQEYIQPSNTKATNPPVYIIGGDGPTRRRLHDFLHHIGYDPIMFNDPADAVLALQKNSRNDTLPAFIFGSFLMGENIHGANERILTARRFLDKNLNFGVPMICVTQNKKQAKEFNSKRPYCSITEEALLQYTDERYQGDKNVQNFWEDVELLRNAWAVDVIEKESAPHK
ncbi:MAG: hypothetical protein CMM93_05545 [Rickettsiales bacterium]|nr:hypothetical protein [Rickettsiales bacterium]|tara:strand:- start:100 stop:618 length:519 start_codon:yes stop_codon:yes gene_type:complete